MRLRLSTDDERTSHIEDLVIRLADLSVLAGRWTPEEARSLSRAAIDAGLPEPGRFFFTAEDDAGPVGAIYLGMAHPDGFFPGAAWVHDVVVFPSRRGQGLGRALMAAVEQEVLARGGTGLALNVMTANEPAMRLYAAAGYAAVTQTMIKQF
ncbi:GNAT family N-acetyltransferase [Catenuloplanes japonicus]|uniref:GNAT family N-acetyltransferase n=1 Tax=Catenuloplanes japonicus TaxID=33876 RepID=UPI000689CA80|nr:GNAT family N-acetyltransferase [Catenuloplanes japonicus]